MKRTTIILLTLCVLLCGCAQQRDEAPPVTEETDAHTFAPELLPAEDCLGRICSISTVGCPPAIPPVMPGEVITREVLECFKYYGVGTCRVVR